MHDLADETTRANWIMTVIAMARQFGTEDDAIADAMCDRLGLERIEPPGQDVSRQVGADRETVMRLADEQLTTFRDRWRQYEHGALYDHGEQVYQAVKRGNVLIRGGGAPHLLRPVPHVMRVRIIAPLEHRIQVLRERWALDDEEEIAGIIERLDDARDRINDEVFDIEEDTNPTLYDVVLNTGNLRVADCVEVLVTLSGRSTFEENEHGRSMLKNEHLALRVRGAIYQVPEMLSTRASVQVEVDARTGVVALSGSVGTHRVARKIEEKAASVESVSTVTNDIQVHSIMV
jgi:cytidylate kinase